LVINGNLNKGVSLEEADNAIGKIIEELRTQAFDETELTKVKNQSETTMVFSEIELLNRAMSIAFAANAGNAAWCNQDIDKLRAVTTKSMFDSAQEILAATNCSTLFYKAV
jgi:hypothetical protein